MQLTKEGIRQYITQTDNRGNKIPFGFETMEISTDELTWEQQTELAMLTQLYREELEEKITALIKHYIKENKEKENENAPIRYPLRYNYRSSQ